MSRSFSVVVDARTGEPLHGIASDVLYERCSTGRSRRRDGGRRRQVTDRDLKLQALEPARSRSLTPADLVRINSREVKALQKRSDAGLYSFSNRKETK